VTRRAESSTLVPVLGALGAGAFLIRAFRQNGTPPLLQVLIGLWVLAPFAALLSTRLFAGRWLNDRRHALGRAIVVGTLAPLVVYAINVVRPLSDKAAAVFVITPPLSLAAAVATFALGITAVRPR